MTQSNTSARVNFTEVYSFVDSLDRKWLQRRTLTSLLVTACILLATLTAVVPLVSILAMLVYRGCAGISRASFVSLPPAAFEEGGGFGNAIVGTLIIVLIATLISTPIGIFGAVYLAELGKSNWLTTLLRFSAKTLNGLPSILAGVFVYGVVVLMFGGFSAIAGSIALSLLMIPTIVLVSEESLKGVAANMKEAAMAMGATKTQAVLKISLPAASSGILTGIMLAVARAAGETAPLLFTALFSNYWIMQDGRLSLMQPTASLSVLIYNFSASPFDNQIQLAWSASLVLVLLVLTTNLVGKSISRRSTPR
jgi:phosphate transport system permease protein